MARSLYDLTAEWDYVFRALEDEEADADSIIESCKQIEAEMREKVENMAKIVRMFELDAQDAKAEASRLAARAKTDETRAARLRQAIFDMMKATGQSKLKTPTFSFGISPTPASVRITDLDAAMCSGYLKDIQPSEAMLDKQAMKRDLELGIPVPGAELVRGECLRMR